MLRKGHDKYYNRGGKEKAAEYYQKNKEMGKKEKGTGINQWQKEMKK